MARAQALDPLHNFRFFAEAMVDGTDALAYVDSDGAQAGFMSVTTPEMSLEAAEYREGTYQWTKKFAGIPTWTEVTFMRGVMKNDTSFFTWIMAAAGNEEYRADLTIYHWHRDGKSPGQVGDLSKARLYKLFEGIPVRIKIAGDLDANASDISLAEIDVSYEYAEITAAS